MSQKLLINSTWKNDMDDGNEQSEKEGHLENYWVIKATTVLLDKDQADETIRAYLERRFTHSDTGPKGVDEEEEFLGRKIEKNGWNKEE